MEMILEKTEKSIKSAKSLKSRSIGQLLLLKGYKKIKRSDIEKRFFIDGVTIKLQEEAKKQCSDLVEKKKHELEQQGLIVTGTDIHFKSLKDIEQELKTSWWKRQMLKREDGFVHGTVRFKKSHLHVSDDVEIVVEPKIAEVRSIDFDHYVEEVIPDRVYDSVEEAKKLGCNKFEVHYPVITTLSESQEFQRFQRLKDPIVTFRFGPAMFEIDFWE